ncbi:MAG: hypothetical protein CMJ77_04690 [Planctomycetaceae bacterium]|nr:hypothetical protein [Planctomycetaceae bacterium]
MNAMVKWTLLIQVGATLAMVGLIWFVQVVHYPLFSEVGRDSFRRYEMDHQRLTTYVVAPLMLAELATAVMLLWWRPSAISTPWVWLGLVLLGSIWIMTYAVQVPQHAALANSYDEDIQRRLVFGNWYRTFAWTARGGIVLWMVSQVISFSPAQHLLRNPAP